MLDRSFGDSEAPAACKKSLPEATVGKVGSNR